MVIAREPKQSRDLAFYSEIAADLAGPRNERMEEGRRFPNRDLS